MKTASLLYPYDSVFKTIEAMLKKKGCAILSVNDVEGTIKAHCKKDHLLEKSKALDLKVKRIDNNITDVIFMINSNQHVYDTPTTEDEFAEEELFDTINKYF